MCREQWRDQSQEEMDLLAEATSLTNELFRLVQEREKVYHEASYFEDGIPAKVDMSKIAQITGKIHENNERWTKVSEALYPIENDEI